MNRAICVFLKIRLQGKLSLCAKHRGKKLFPAIDFMCKCVTDVNAYIW